LLGKFIFNGLPSGKPADGAAPAPAAK
jgi:hypothetical protein